MPVRCVVLDFDGTFTLAEEEAAGFDRSFPLLLGDVLGRVLGEEWPAALRNAVAAAPEAGWMFDGVASAPADADPYIAASCAAQRVLDAAGVLQDASLRADVVGVIYRHAYRHTSTVLRPEAKEVLEALLARGLPVHVITNASADVATQKLASLAPRGFEKLHVLGDARKFLVTPPKVTHAAFLQLPATQAVEGLTRPVQLKRGAYLDALCRVWGETGTSAATTLVCGDIYELDLALPMALGAQGHLVRRPTTHAYEVNAMAAAGARGGVSHGLRGLLERL